MKTSALAVLILFLTNSSLFTKTFYITPQGNDSNNGTSYATAFLTIQAATNRVVAGDSVLVYDGFYKGFDHFYKNSGTAGSPIVYLAKGSNVVINQDCGRGYDGLNIEGNDYIEVNGFKVYKIAHPTGTGEDGIRAVVANHITIRNCEVDSCYRGIFTGYTDDFLAENNVCKRSYGEHGIYVSNNSDRVIVRNNLCFGNKAAGIQLNPDLSSGAPGLSYDVSIYHNVCYNNRIGLNLQGLYNSVVYNNLIYNNGSGGGGNGITLFHGDAATGCHNVKVYNNTVVVPSTSQWCILAIDGDSLFVMNNILLSQSSKGSLDIESSCVNYFGDYNLLNDKMTIDQGNSYINFSAWQAKGNDLHSILVMDNSSVFFNMAGNDYHLSTNSQALDHGTSVVSSFVKNDLDGNLRPLGVQYDIGCYEKARGTRVEETHDNKRFTIVHDGPLLIFTDLDQDEFAEIFSINGILVGTGRVINTHTYPTGLYFYRVRTLKENHQIASGKILIGLN